MKFLCSKSGKLFNNYLICDLYNRSKIAENANHLENQNKENCVLEFSVGKGKVIVFPEGSVSLIHNNSTIRKNFYSEFSKEYTSERVAKVSKGVIRIHIQKALEYLFQKRNLPFVHLWFFPGDAKNIFCFRVDTDMGSREEIISLNNLLQDFNIPSTWFVETKSSESWIKLFSELDNQEIAFHCYKHKTFLSYKKIEGDVQTGLKILESVGIKPKGYAAPYGKWNETIAKVIDNFGFLYSSEFDFAYDALPLYPFYKSTFSKALQIPIHPVSVGRLHWGGHSEENMVKYFLNIIEQKLFLNEPVILYTHPFEKRLKVFEKVFKQIKEFDPGKSANQEISILTFSKYAEWWKKRLSINWNAEVKDGKVFISASNMDESIKCRVNYPSGEKTLLSLNQDEENKIEEDNFEFHNSFPKDPWYNPNELRRKNLQMVKYDIIGILRKLKQ